MTSTDHSTTKIESLRVIALVTLPIWAGGNGEVLALHAEGGGRRLPDGPLLPGERVLDAAARIARETTGLVVRSDRLVYFLEDSGARAWVVLCEPLLDDPSNDAAESAEFVNPSEIEAFEPEALRELLIEDLAGGLVRPVAHVVVETQPASQIVVHW